MRMRKRWILAVLPVSLLVAWGVLPDQPAPVEPTDDRSVATLLRSLPESPISYRRTIRPILERRCVVCHGCYDAPCQLKLSSPEGLQRGASKNRVYDPSRLAATQPTRLFIDARSTDEWRRLAFHPVLNEDRQTPEYNLSRSLLYQLLRLKQLHPQPRSGRLPQAFTLDIDREQVCTTLDGFSDYASEHPLWGMPYAMPELAPDEYRPLVQWIAQGAPLPPPPHASDAARAQIRVWETFLNGADNKQRLVSRYLYEHLFHAHLHFAGTSSREFYRLVRSSTPPGKPVDEIATIRPYDDPGKPFYYRLTLYRPVVVAKNHMVYSLSDRRLQRLRELFLEPEYAVPELPSYRPETASNPFKVYAAIPPRSRYRFLLDDARFFIEGFVKGPVCRGQVALSVIEDRFWVMFFDPEREIFTTEPAFINRMAGNLQLPAERGDSLDGLSIWNDYWKKEKRYMEAKQAWFEHVQVHDIAHAMEYIWDGEGTNPSAALTVFRHFDSASVAYGLVGEPPETAWIIDYPLLERIHYLLVAGFNVFGNIVHQVNTRIYMDFLRMEGEDYFLAFLPADVRKSIRDDWYQGLRGGIAKLFQEPIGWLKVDMVKGYRSDDPQRELYRYLQARLRKTAPAQAALNRCDDLSCMSPARSAAERRVDQAMEEIHRKKGVALHAFPEVAYVVVKTGDGEKDLVYSLIRNKAYKNVASFFAGDGERDRSDVERDTMTVVKWLEGSYPNFFFVVDLEDIEAFSEQCAAIASYDDYERFVEKYGIRRTNTSFWRTSDWFHDRYLEEKPLRAGILDLSRYRNR